MRVALIALRCGFLALLLLGAVAAPGAGLAQESAIGTGDATAIRQVITDQMTAFRQDDSETAFGFAAPALREQFGNAANFMRMVRAGYQAVYRPRDVQFGTVEAVEGIPVQNVLVVAPDGTVIEAHYFMERQPDGSWRIAGCTLTHSEQKTS
jgi:hypothetical protein